MDATSAGCPNLLLGRHVAAHARWHCLALRLGLFTGCTQALAVHRAVRRPGGNDLVLALPEVRGLPKWLASCLRGAVSRGRHSARGAAPPRLRNRTGPARRELICRAAARLPVPNAH